MFKSLMVLLFGMILLLLAVPVQAERASVEIEWMPAPTATGYRIHYGIDTDNKIYSIDAEQATTWTVKDLECGVEYFFEVTAYNADGEDSPPTQTIRATTPDCVPPVVLPEGWTTGGIWLVPKP